ncbi:MAG: hypothetical protein RML94_16135, partial [Bacteroidia bacterium]|nr:hypothetical protein [Bacteroidia bacterium]
LRFAPHWAYAHPPHASRKESLKKSFLCNLCKVLACKCLYFKLKQGKDITNAKSNLLFTVRFAHLKSTVPLPDEVYMDIFVLFLRSSNMLAVFSQNGYESDKK